MIGTSRLSYPESIYAIRVPTTLLIDLDQILFAFAYGADGIVLLEAEESFKVKIIEKRISEIREYLKKYDIEKDRLSFLPALLPTFRAMSEQLTSYAKKIKALGKLNERNREKLKAAQLKESS
jgi:heterodisulfide reductase subunit A